MAQMRKRVRRKTISRSNLIILVFILVGIAVTAKLFYLQVMRYDHYHKKVMEEITVETKVNPKRGTIYDTNGNILATNGTVYLCFISPVDVMNAKDEARKEKEEVKDNKSETAKKDEEEVDRTVWTSSDGTVYRNLEEDSLIAHFFSETLDVDYDEVIRKAAVEKSQYQVIAKEISEEKADVIREFIDTYGLNHEVYLRADTKRYYPGNDFASHVLGFCNKDGVGTYGLEAYYNNLLEGTSGRYVTAQDARSNEMDFEYETYIDPENGYNMTVTLDSYIQFVLENEIENTLKENMAANRVTGIAMNVNDGSILGMATAPSFDCNDPYILDELSEAKLAAFPGSEDETEAIRKLAEDALTEKTPGIDKTSEKFASDVDSYVNLNRKKLTEDAYSDEYFNLLFEMWKNKAVTELYEPGSTSKIITTAMAFQERVVSPGDMFTCTGSLKIDGYPKPIHCHEHGGHGTVTYARGLQQSCNPTLMQAAFRVGREKFYKYFEDFGYKDITGIDLPNEAKTYSHSYSDFSNVSLAVYSFGQTYKTTAIQQLTAIAAVANGGNLVTPHLMKEITDDEGNIIKSYGTDVKRQVISSDVCREIAGILQEGVATDGGAKNAYVKGYKVAAKTGTSEKIDEKDPTGETYLRVGSCVAFAPADDPEIAVIIIVDEPMGGSVYGSVVAAPYVSDFLSNVLPYMGYEPQYTEEELNNLEISLIDYKEYDVSAAKSDITNKGMRAVVVGNGDKITGQTPAPGSTMSKDGGKVILYTGGETPKDTVEVPDIVGKNAEQANVTLINAGLNISVSGNTAHADSTVMKQSVPAGTKVPEGTLVEISLRVMSNAADD